MSPVINRFSRLCTRRCASTTPFGVVRHAVGSHMVPAAAGCAGHGAVFHPPGFLQFHAPDASLSDLAAEQFIQSACTAFLHIGEGPVEFRTGNAQRILSSGSRVTRESGLGTCSRRRLSRMNLRLLSQTVFPAATLHSACRWYPFSCGSGGDRRRSVSMKGGVFRAMLRD